MKSSLTALPQPRRKLRILLAEDNPVNQRVAVAILEGRGHELIVAKNGREAIDLFQRESFDIILMDVQMPEMDGFEATAAIREMERLTGGHIPIIAMTAYALKGDEERCLSSGMDDYISKPVLRQKLIQMVEKFSVTLDSSNSESDPREPESLEGGDGRSEDAREPHSTKDVKSLPEALFDPAQALDMVGGRIDLLKEMITIFAEQSSDLLSEIQHSIEQLDSRKLERAAHTLKGSVSNFGAREALNAAARMEKLGRDDELAQAGSFYDELERRIERLAYVLKIYYSS